MRSGSENGPNCFTTAARQTFPVHLLTSFSVGNSGATCLSGCLFLSDVSSFSSYGVPLTSLALGSPFSWQVWILTSHSPYFVFLRPICLDASSFDWILTSHPLPAFLALDTPFFWHIKARCSYTRKPSHTEAFTRKNYCHTQIILHWEAFTHRNSYTQALLHMESL